VLQQRDEPAGQAVAQRLVAGDGEQPEEVLELLGADPPGARRFSSASSRA
jgi:hypothetical protein